MSLIELALRVRIQMEVHLGRELNEFLDSTVKIVRLMSCLVAEQKYGLHEAEDLDEFALFLDEQLRPNMRL